MRLYFVIHKEDLVSKDDEFGKSDEEAGDCQLLGPKCRVSADGISLNWLRKVQSWGNSHSKGST